MKPSTSGTRVAGLQRVSILYDAGGLWREICRALPDGFGGGWIEIPSPGLSGNGWVVALLDVRASLLRVGTLGAAWALFEPEEHVQLWVPSKIEVPEGVLGPGRARGGGHVKTFERGSVKIFHSGDLGSTGVVQITNGDMRIAVPQRVLVEFVAQLVSDARISALEQAEPFEVLGIGWLS